MGYSTISVLSRNRSFLRTNFVFICRAIVWMKRACTLRIIKILCSSEPLKVSIWVAQMAWCNVGLIPNKTWYDAMSVGASKLISMTIELHQLWIRNKPVYCGEYFLLFACMTSTNLWLFYLNSFTVGARAQGDFAPQLAERLPWSLSSREILGRGQEVQEARRNLSLDPNSTMFFISHDISRILF